MSAYSGRSIPRPRIYPMENQGIADDLRSHVSHFSGVAGKMNKQRYRVDIVALNFTGISTNYFFVIS